MALTRRRFVWIAAAAPIAACSASNMGTGSGIDPADDDAGAGPDPDAGSEGEPDAGADAGQELPPVDEQPAFDFVHGVASGDPLTDRVILWTRLSPMEVNDGTDLGELLVDFVVATDPTMTSVVGHGRASTSAERDYTVKVDVDGLAPATTYYYEFFDPSRDDVRSTLGRTRTLPTGSVDRARFAVASCSCYALGYFHSYADIAARNDLDAVLHLGDYIYEYGPEVYADQQVMRPHSPDHEIITLEDYRTRFAQYRTDPDLQEAHRQHPFITVWDDHETANDTYRDGAENHTEGTEGSFTDRRQAALTAYHEWMPIRDLDPDDLSHIYRTFSFGDLCDLMMLETRMQRDEQDSSARDNPARTLLGPAQTEWLASELSRSYGRGATWRLLGQQVMFGQLPGGVNADQWDGYTASRNRILDQLTSEGIDNLVVLTGDIHSAWAMDVAKDTSAYDPNTGAGAQCVEFVCTSVTSPAIEGLIGGIGVFFLKQLCPYMKYIDLESHGYTIVDVNHERVQGEWYVVEDIKSETGRAHSFAIGFTVQSGVAHIVETAEQSTPIAGRPPLA